MADLFLYEKIHNYIQDGMLTLKELPTCIIDNIPKNFNLREYQIEALQYFIASFELSTKKNKQIWNLFHMATGSGKTNMMGALILYLYSKGYRNFIFFVNAVNIVEKTKANFLNKEFKKYVFAQDIVIDKIKIDINIVNSFSNVDEYAINIMFTTIHNLHEKLSTPKENAISFSDFEDKAIVLLADEAHHFSAATKKPSQKEIKEFELEEKTWESTITKIYRANKDNILLEFTATCDTKNKNIVEKYMGNPADIVYDYSLLKFRESGYTKDLMNLRTTLSPIDRTIQAMLLSQYRLKIFEKNGIANSKPVVLLKAYKETKNLDAFFDDFVDFMSNNFSGKIIDKIRKQTDPNNIIKEMFNYFKTNNITDNDLVQELKQAFAEEHIVKVHSKISNVDELQIQLNDLENPNNPYRMVMTLDMLHEGWDVLNLFDIVRLYDERHGGQSISTQATIQEAQLIGRGARYFPYSLEFTDDKYKRKFDKDIHNEMRICETLYYHCIDDSRYINEIKTALKDTGFTFSDDAYDFEYKVKDSFKKTKTYTNGKLFVNKTIKVDKNDITCIPSNITIDVVKDLTGHSFVSALYETKDMNGNEKPTIQIKTNTYKIKSLAETNKSLILKAIRQFPIFDFNVLHDYFPNLQTYQEFITSNDYAGKYEFTIKTKEEPTILDIYDGVLEVFDKLAHKIATIKEIFKGTHQFEEVPLINYIVDTKRKKNMAPDALEAQEGEGISQNANAINNAYRIDLSDKDWFVYNDNFGTTEEKRFVFYFSTKINELKKKYDEIYLIRNERNFHIYSFKDGKRFEPDYILILNKNGIIMQQQQIFIEPKGEHLRKQDQWKEDFLIELEKNAECICYHKQNEEYKILGLPFFTHNVNNGQDFKEDFEKLLQ